MAAVAESAVLELDACGALRADLAAHAVPDDRRREPGGVARRGAASGAGVPGDAERAAAWLPLVAGLERAARLPSRERPGHFRRQRSAWHAAADAFGEVHYAAVGERLAKWRAGDPRLSLVKDLLWALEQPEAAGYTRLALAGLTALGALVPVGDVRSGYVLAQSARAIRTLGDSQGAVERYTLGGRIGRRYMDRWLCVRSALGLGATHHHRGNYPAARTVFQSILKKGAPDARFTAAAHHGLLVNAMVAHDWNAALKEGWFLLQAGRSGAIVRAEVLNLMAELCHRIGQYRAAISAAEASLMVAERPDHTIIALEVLVDVAAASHDRELGARYGPLLRAHVGRSAGPFEDARALLALAGLEHMVGARDAALNDIANARRIADAFRYHELQFQAEELSALVISGAITGTEVHAGPDRFKADVSLSGRSQYIVSQLDQWSEHDVVGGSRASNVLEVPAARPRCV